MLRLRSRNSLCFIFPGCCAAWVRRTPFLSFLLAQELTLFLVPGYSGCHVLALKLVRSWEFHILPATPQAPHPNSVSKRHTLRRMSTRIDMLDMEVPSAEPSRTNSPGPNAQGIAEFRAVLKEAKKEAVAPEFDLGSFQF